MVYTCAPAAGLVEPTTFPGAPGDNTIFITSPQQSSLCRSSICGIVFLFILIAVLWFFWLPARPPTEMIVEKTPQKSYGSTTIPTVQTDVPTRPYNQPMGDLKQTVGSAQANVGCVNPQAPSIITPTNGNNLQMANSNIAIPTVPQNPQVSSPMIAANVAIGGAPLDSSTYGLSEESSEYYKHFKPISLESTMPMGWRSSTNSTNCGSTGDDIYNEFSRYAISPNQMKRAENMRSVLRLSESSRDGLSRTLGQRSLLRDFVTPLGPSPIGDNAMLWNDSSVRQNYIASATGRFPTVAENC